MVTHVMSDGSRRQSIDGYVVPRDHPIYRAIQKCYEMQKMVVPENKRAQMRWRAVNGPYP